MKPNELRIGNWVSHEDYSTEMFRVETIRYETGDINDYIVDTVGGKNGTWSNHIDLIVPIPLTQELLLKLGFEYIDSGQPEDHEDYHEWLEKTYPTIGCVYSGDGDYVFCEKFDDQRIYDLHQLQNLYFAITGEELTIEL